MIGIVFFIISITFYSISLFGQIQDSVQIDSLNILKEKIFQDSIAQLNQENRNFNFESPWEGTKYIKDEKKNKNKNE